MKTKIIYIAILCGLCLFSLSTISIIQKQNKELLRVQQNYNATNQLFSSYKDKTGRLIAQSEVLQLTNQELKKDLFAKNLYILSIKPSRAITAGETAIRTTDSIFVPVYDTFLLEPDPNYNDTCKRFGYVDGYSIIEGVICNDTANIHYAVFDTVFTSIYKGKRLKPWLWFFSPRTIEAKQRNSNPHSTIYYTRQILKSN